MKNKKSPCLIKEGGPVMHHAGLKLVSSNMLSIDQILEYDVENKGKIHVNRPLSFFIWKKVLCFKNNFISFNNLENYHIASQIHL